MKKVDLELEVIESRVTLPAVPVLCCCCCNCNSNSSGGEPPAE